MLALAGDDDPVNQPGGEAEQNHNSDGVCPGKCARQKDGDSAKQLEYRNYEDGPKNCQANSPLHYFVHLFVKLLGEMRWVQYTTNYAQSQAIGLDTSVF